MLNESNPQSPYMHLILHESGRASDMTGHIILSTLCNCTKVRLMKACVLRYVILYTTCFASNRFVSRAVHPTTVHCLYANRKSKKSKVRLYYSAL